MKPEILDFYTEKAFEPYKFIRKRPQAPELEIFWAMEEVYKEIQDGLEIDDILIPGRVFALIDSPKYEELEKYRDDIHDLIEAQEIIDKLKADHKLKVDELMAYNDKWVRYALLGFTLTLWAFGIAAMTLFKDMPCY